MIWVAFAGLAATALISILMMVLMGRLVLAMLKKQGLVEANEMLIPKFRPRRDGKQPVTTAPPELDLTNLPRQPIGLDGSA